MKNTITAKIILTLISVMIALSLTVSVGAAIPEDEEDLENGIFILGHTDGEETIITSAFYAEDPVSGTPYIVTTSSTSGFVEAGYYSAILGSNDLVEDAVYVGSNGYFSFYTAEGLEGRKPFTMGDDFDYEINVVILEMTDDDETRIDGDYFDTNEDNWIDCGNYRYWENEEIEVEWLGAPVFNANDGTVIGCVAMTEEGLFAIVSAEDIEFPKTNTTVTTEAPETAKPETAPTPAETTPETETEAETEEATGTGERTNVEGGTVLLIAAGVVGIGALVYGSNKKKSSDKNISSEVSSVENGTISLEVKETTAPESYPETAPGKDPVPMVNVNTAANWQIRGISGAMEGKVFLLTGKLSLGRNPGCDVQFSASTPGISGAHCELEVIDGKVVLRDMRSTYGTYLTKNVKMEPSVNYYLNAGDEFTLAEGADTFRLEPAGAYKTELTPAVKSVANGNTYRADLDGKITFGRNPASRVNFDASESAVSGQHCVLYREGSDLFLMDTGSTNGTFFSENERLKPNTPYKVKRGVSFFLSSPKNTFVITED